MNVKIFENEEFNWSVRATATNGELLFIAKDIAVILGFSNPQKAIRDHCQYAISMDRVNVLTTPKEGVNNLDTPIDPQTKLITESDISRLVARSKMLNADVFWNWLKKDVLLTWGKKKEKYWEHEMPVEVNTGKNILRYFEEFGKLQIAFSGWESKNGQKYHGKKIGLDLVALKRSPLALDLIKRIIQ
jgi:prophage antirepressor-like protein